ncbi:MAG TPA: IPT/TIG domain-containing protein [Ktedonobacteraceae bacterium]|nr:IPT/TIG domain-containing protein [Ktedonobacteraceae bacterium]
MHHLRLRAVVLLSACLLMLLLASAPSALASSFQSDRAASCPSITSFSPTSGAPGTSVVLTGCGLTGTTSVTFHGVVASFVVNSDTQITAMVPVGATSGVIAVYTPTKTVKSPGKFIVLKTSASITLSPTAGPPTSSITVTGSGFSKNKAVDVYFDTSDEALAGTDGQGAFSITITVPADAVPGTHTVSAVQRYTGLTAQASFLVQTNWDEFGYNLQHSGTNPYENVLNPSNVSSMLLDWTAPTTYEIFSSPAVANGMLYDASEDGKLYAYTLPLQDRVQPPARPNPSRLYPNLNLPLSH